MSAEPAIFTITPYRWNGVWVFDDPKVGLDREPFVAGMDAIIDVATQNIPDADRGFTATFSAFIFPGADIVLTWDREELGGNVYRWDDANMEGWLCPALFKYFDAPPRNIYVRTLPLTANSPRAMVNS